MAQVQTFIRRGPIRKTEPAHKINNNIRSPQVRLVGENISQGVYSIQDALRIASDNEMDLVEISSNANPPVCKVIDYKKFVYELKKKQKSIKSKAAKSIVKEIRFGPHTDTHDVEFKLNHARKFLDDGAKVKAYVHFKGRSIVFQEQGQILLLKFAQDLEAVGKVEQMPKLEGKRMIMLIVPKSGK